MTLTFIDIEAHNLHPDPDSIVFVNNLYRMYARWADANGYECGLIEYSEVASVRALLYIDGNYREGLLSTEDGLHELLIRRGRVRANVRVCDDWYNVDIPDEDIDGVVFATGDGPFPPSKQVSVKLTHKPTGTMAICQRYRTTYTNWIMATKILKAKLHFQELKVIRTYDINQEHWRDVLDGNLDGLLGEATR